MGRKRGPSSRASRISAFEAETTSSRALLAHADRGLSSIRSDIAKLREPKGVPEQPYLPQDVPQNTEALAHVRPQSRLMPRRGLRSPRLFFAGALLAAGVYWGWDLLTPAGPRAISRLGDKKAAEDQLDWAQTWQPVQPQSLSARAMTTAIGGLAVAQKPSAGGAVPPASVPRRAEHVREAARGQVVKRVLAPRSAPAVQASPGNRQWTGTFFAR